MEKNIVLSNPIVVMKFGGTSLRNEESRAQAIKHIQSQFDSGKQIIVVVSAMGRKGEPYATDTLISLLKDIGEPVNPEELDSVISIGETLSAAYFSHLLSKNGLSSESFSGVKTGILTDDNPGNAEILEIDTFRLKVALKKGKIPVVAGFQGVNKKGDIRTLGRGGSDTSAVALGSAMEAKYVEIYSDVDGIANCDPNMTPKASFLKKISITQVMTMANEGSKVLHPRAVQASKKNKTTIVVRNTFTEAKGTMICHDDSKELIDQIVLAHRSDMTMIEVKAKTNLKSFFPEMIFIDEKRFLLKNDIYLKNKIKELQESLGSIKTDNGWATISIVFDKRAIKSISIPGAEKIPASKNVICYLLKQEKLIVSLKLLFEHYNL